MKKVQLLLSPFHPQPALFARVCLPAPGQAGLPGKTRCETQCAVPVTGNLSAFIATFFHFSIYR
jgi:hypothetical protein